MIGANQRRTAQCGEDAARFGGLAGNRLADGGAKLRGLGCFLGQQARARPDEVSVSGPAEHLKACQAAFTEAGSVILHRALTCIAHGRLARLFPAWADPHRDAGYPVVVWCGVR